MNKRDKKRLKALRGKLEKLQQRLVGAKQQADDPGEVGRREADIEEVLTQIRRLKDS